MSVIQLFIEKTKNVVSFTSLYINYIFSQQCQEVYCTVGSAELALAHLETERKMQKSFIFILDLGKSFDEEERNLRVLPYRQPDDCAT